ncbi:MAG: hypothetical protein AAFX07_04315 [Pseudomonadota bacterium]
MKSLLVPIITSIFVGMFLFHYKDFFDPPNIIYYVERDFNVTQTLGKDVLTSRFSLHNETENAVEDIVVTGQASTDIQLATTTLVNASGADKQGQISVNGDAFLITIPKILSGEVIYLRIDVDAGSNSKFHIEFSDSVRLIPESRLHLSSYNKGVIILVASRVLFFMCYVCIILGFYLRYRQALFPGFFRDSSEAGFALLHSGAITEAKDYFESLKISAKGYSVYDLAHLSTCYAILGNHSSADDFLHAAKIRSYSSNSPIIALNRLIVLDARGELTEDQTLQLGKMLRKYVPDTKLYDLSDEPKKGKLLRRFRVDSVKSVSP